MPFECLMSFWKTNHRTIARNTHGFRKPDEFSVPLSGWKHANRAHEICNKFLLLFYLKLIWIAPHLYSMMQLKIKHSSPAPKQNAEMFQQLYAVGIHDHWATRTVLDKRCTPCASLSAARNRMIQSMPQVLKKGTHRKSQLLPKKLKSRVFFHQPKFKHLFNLSRVLVGSKKVGDFKLRLQLTTVTSNISHVFV